MADRVCGHGFQYDVHVGFGETERQEAQRISVDFEARTDWRAAAKADRASPVVDYAEVDKRLHPAAALSVLAHMQDLTNRGLVACDGEKPGLDSSYRLN